MPEVYGSSHLAEIFIMIFNNFFPLVYIPSTVSPPTSLLLLSSYFPSILSPHLSIPPLFRKVETSHVSQKLMCYHVEVGPSNPALPQGLHKASLQGEYVPKIYSCTRDK